MATAETTSLSPSQNTNEIEKLKAQLAEVRKLANRLSITILGAEADAVDATGPIRSPKTIERLNDSLKQAKHGIAELRERLKD